MSRGTPNVALLQDTIAGSCDADEADALHHSHRENTPEKRRALTTPQPRLTEPTYAMPNPERALSKKHSLVTVTPEIFSDAQIVTPPSHSQPALSVAPQRFHCNNPSKDSIKPLKRFYRTPKSRSRKRCRQTGSRQSTPLIGDTDPIRKFSIDPASHTDWQKQAEFSPKRKPMRNFSIDPTSSIRTPIADAIFAGHFRDSYKRFYRTPFSPQVDDTRSQMNLEINSVLITLTLTCLIVGINFLGVAGNGWTTLTLWTLHLHSSIVF